MFDIDKINYMMLELHHLNAQVHFQEQKTLLIKVSIRKFSQPNNILLTVEKWNNLTK